MTLTLYGTFTMSLPLNAATLQTRYAPGVGGATLSPGAKSAGASVEVRAAAWFNESGSAHGAALRAPLNPSSAQPDELTQRFVRSLCGDGDPSQPV
jgi:hypothetical protein